MSTTFRDIVDDVVSRFDESTEKDADTLAECIDDTLIYNCDIFIVVAECGDVDENLDGTIHQYAFDILFDYIIDYGSVELADD